MTLRAVEPRPAYVAGRWATAGEAFTVPNPADPLSSAGATYFATDDQYEEAVAGASAAFEQTRRLPAYERGRILREVAAGILERREHLARLISTEVGKPIRESYFEVDRSALTFRLGAEEAERMVGEVIPLDIAPYAKDRVAITRRVPLGPIAAICPFNYPLHLAAHKLAPAIAAGNSIVLKPSTRVPLTILALAEILHETGIPPGAVSILPMSRSTAEQMARDPRFSLLSFTGSPDVGWRLREIAGRKRVVLELGGNAAVVVDKSADIDWAVERCLIGSFTNAGQACISIQRMFIHEEVWDQFMDGFIAGAAALRIGDPLDPETQLGPMIEEAEAERAQEWVDEAVSLGGRLLLGGTRERSTLHPTILADVPPDARVCSREVFAPVVTASRFTTMDEAVRRINESRFGIHAGVITNDLAAAWAAANELHVSGVIINDIPSFRTDHMPYGGVKESGVGREGIRFAIEEMTEMRVIVLVPGR